MKHIVYLSVLIVALFASSNISHGRSVLDSEVVREFGGDRTSVQRSISLLQRKLQRAVTVSTSRDSYPSLSEAQYKDFLAGHYQMVVDQARLVRKRILEENDRSDLRQTILPKVDSIIALHDQTTFDSATTPDFWKEIILMMDRIFTEREEAKKPISRAEEALGVDK